MKLLRCSSGISNPSINDALVDLLGKPIAEASALCIPTGVEPFPRRPVARLRPPNPHVRPGLEVARSARAHPNREDGHPPTPLSEIEAWAAGLAVPAHVIDDRTAVKVTDGTVEVVSEGQWKLLASS